MWRYSCSSQTSREKAAGWLLLGIPEIKKLIELGGIRMVRHPRHSKGVHGTLASYAECFQQSLPFVNKLALECHDPPIRHEDTRI